MPLIVAKLPSLDSNFLHPIFSSFLTLKFSIFNLRFQVLSLLNLILYFITKLTWKVPLSFQKYFIEFEVTFCFFDPILTPQYFFTNSVPKDQDQTILFQAILNHQHQCLIARSKITNYSQMLKLYRHRNPSPSSSSHLH